MTNVTTSGFYKQKGSRQKSAR